MGEEWIVVLWSKISKENKGSSGKMSGSPWCGEDILKMEILAYFISFLELIRYES